MAVAKLLFSLQLEDKNCPYPFLLNQGLNVDEQSKESSHMHRKLRGAKFSEYISTYALLNRIGIHQTAVIERRQAVEGYGWFVRDACDAGTVLCVVPLKLAVSAANGRERGAPVVCASFSTCPVGVLLPHLLQAPDWVELAWRIAIEAGVQSSPLWWGWINSLPDAAQLQQQREHCMQRCRVSPSTLHLTPYLEHLRLVIKSEVSAAFLAARDVQPVSPPQGRFEWAVDIALSRSLLCPTADLEPRVEPTVLPFIDLVNHAAEPNAEIEMAATLADLPSWYRDDVIGGITKVPEPPYVVLTTTKSMMPGSQVFIHYQYPTTIVDAALGTRLKYERDGPLLTRMLRFALVDV